MTKPNNVIHLHKRRTFRLSHLVALVGFVAFSATLAGTFIFDVTAESTAPIAGEARVIDGDTLDISGQRVRIHGIDAPESAQNCARGGITWLCGQEAAKAMRALLRGSQAKCEVIDKDRYGRIVAKCFSEGRDVGEALVQYGLALAYRQYSSDYVQAEASAKAARRGLWAGDFIEPWDWRRGKRLSSSSANDNAACDIKGNIGKGGERIYHVPGGQYYDRTRIDASKGEKMFCSEADAVAAGWRRSSR